MKTIGLLLIALSLTLSVVIAQAQPLPDDLTGISPESAFPSAEYFSISHWPVWPPMPATVAAGILSGALYYSPRIGPDTIFVDDTQAGAAMSANDDLLPPGFDPNSTNEYTYDSMTSQQRSQRCPVETQNLGAVTVCTFFISRPVPARTAQVLRRAAT